MAASDTTTVSLALILNADHLSDGDVAPIVNAITDQLSTLNITQALCLTFSNVDDLDDSPLPPSSQPPASSPPPST